VSLMKSQPSDINYYTASYTAPSNIAFIKYWGKKDRQIPLNASLSMTLNACHSFVSLKALPAKDEIKKIFDFQFENLPNTKFETRFENYLQSIQDILPWLSDYQFEIRTHNTFPHSTGIASSASAFAALAMGLADLDAKITGTEFSFNKASKLARLGSGSACRSLYPGMVIWGENIKMKASNEFALPVPIIHPLFENLCDSVLIVDNEEKSVKSSVGHSLMHGHLFKEVRLFQAQENFNHLFDAIIQGDLEYFGEIIELEALTLHALMMTSTPSYMLMRPNTILLIEKIKDYRQTSKLPVYFTLDAGPNIHLIYPAQYTEVIKSWIDAELLAYCQKGMVIHDSMGSGAKRAEH
jgi:diphosphomevalonate decarboxylase